MMRLTFFDLLSVCVCVCDLLCMGFHSADNGDKMILMDWVHICSFCDIYVGQVVVEMS